MSLKDFVSMPLFDEKVLLNKNQSWPRISIVTPSYNQGAFLERTILSVLNQNYPNLEYIIIDGGSDDNSVEIIRKYENYLAYWVSEKDNGQSDALNKGFRLCSGDYIGWQNSDDIYLPNALKEFADIVMKYPNYDIYYSNKLNIDETDNIINKVYYVSPSWRYMEYYTKFRGMTFCNQSCFFRDSIFKDVGFIDESLQIAMDTDFFLRCILFKKKAFYSNTFWGALRLHKRAKTQVLDVESGDRRADREYIEKKYCLYRGRFFPCITSGLAVWRALLLLRSGGFRETYRVRKLVQ